MFNIAICDDMENVAPIQLGLEDLMAALFRADY